MRIAELLGDIEPTQDQGVELVTLTIDRTQGPRAKPAVPFATLKDALQYAHSMSAEQRSESWIRTPKKVLSIAEAEAEVATMENDNQEKCRMHMTAARDLFITGLKNAHAMERQAQEMLERQIDRMDKYPELRAKLRDHLGETKEQLKRLESCLSELDSSPSTVKDAALAFGANVAALGHAMAGDEVLKNTFANSALESYEIAAYKSLLAMAEQAGARMKTVLEDSLREEERMAAWVDKNVAKITLNYIREEERATA